MDLPNRINLLNSEPRSWEEVPKEPKKRSCLIWLAIFLVLTIAGCTARHFNAVAWPTDANVYDPVTLQPKKVGILYTVKNFIFSNNNVVEGQNDDRINILLLGMGGPGHDGPYLTDTNIILSIKPSTNEIAMISVPRDLGVEIDGHGIRKINYANAFGEANNPGQGGEYARQLFAKTFDIDIPYYIRADFQAFVELINETGGVVVNVPQTFSDYSFPGPNHSYQTVSFEAGGQSLDGERALQYARSRHGNNGEGSDFARSRRQQQILTALKEKLLSFGTYTNPVRVQSMLQSLSNHINTNLNFGQLMYLANLGREANGPIKMLVIDNSIKGYLLASTAQNGAYILSPKSGDFNDINQAMQNVFSDQEIKTISTLPNENKPVFPTAKIEVQNGTWRVGLAARMQKKLQDEGFSVFAPQNCYRRPIEKTTIYLNNSKIAPEAIKALTKIIPGIVEPAVPDWLSATYDITSTTEDETGVKYNPETDILIILGNDLNEQD
ncbi:MAG: Cell envelope-related transcriptional attenuator [Candidatus Magasanikbacteria bacterium GW2011_GWC2_34_16]|uniref:Cell envelope-related transcriptional attenuator n=1 Tax=Candidatus Magasanikbacteria bacterium GW2011_GWC2_34_16 TaxID=1619045 RepID=A0A0G0AS05_9BACT|nr:MAG: Cell envelope-related transcriptional attenuator [Candidatus Magasanikbacteria bacterium GW2011_GWC2_34_16]